MMYKDALYFFIGRVYFVRKKNSAVNILIVRVSKFKGPNSA